MAVSHTENETSLETLDMSDDDLNPVVNVMFKSWQTLLSQGDPMTHCRLGRQWPGERFNHVRSTSPVAGRRHAAITS